MREESGKSPNRVKGKSRLQGVPALEGRGSGCHCTGSMEGEEGAQHDGGVCFIKGMASTRSPGGGGQRACEWRGDRSGRAAGGGARTLGEPRRTGASRLPAAHPAPARTCAIVARSHRPLTGYRSAGTPSRNLTPLPWSNPTVSAPYFLAHWDTNCPLAVGPRHVAQPTAANLNTRPTASGYRAERSLWTLSWVGGVIQRPVLLWGRRRDAGQFD